MTADLECKAKVLSVAWWIADLDPAERPPAIVTLHDALATAYTPAQLADAKAATPYDLMLLVATIVAESLAITP